MSPQMSLMPLKDQFEFLLKLMQSERFLKMQGLGNELPFYICPYKPEDAVDVEGHLSALVTKLGQVGVQVLHINLYDLSLDILKERGVLDRLVAMEPETSKTDFREPLQNLLDPAGHLVPALAERMDAEPFDILLLSGVGEVYPYIRSHAILNNLQSAATKHPTVLFFPGEYTYGADTGSSLDLFNRLHDDKYYRAFNIYYCEI